MNDIELPHLDKNHLIQVRDLGQDYANGKGVVKVLRDINLHIDPGELVAIMGPSGSGKSTLLFILGLILQPTRGQYYLLDNDALQFDRSRQSAYRLASALALFFKAVIS